MNEPDPVVSFLAKLPTASELQVFGNEHEFGFVVHYSEAGFGFGSIRWVCDKKRRTIRLDTEGLSPDAFERFLGRLEGTMVKPLGDSPYGRPFEEFPDVVQQEVMKDIARQSEQRGEAAH